ncbi:MAG: hypothetical protein ACFCU4_02600 [Puniceicoccaceae bacterium]
MRIVAYPDYPYSASFLKFIESARFASVEEAVLSVRDRRYPFKIVTE